MACTSPAIRVHSSEANSALHPVTFDHLTNIVSYCNISYAKKRSHKKLERKPGTDFGDDTGTCVDVSFSVVKENVGVYSVYLNGLKGSFTVKSRPIIEPTKTIEPEPELIKERDQGIFPVPD
jgi:hypothetical protein